MNNRKQQIEAFFQQYAKRFNNSLRGHVTDVEETANSFADCFIEAGPSGVNCGKNDAQFRTAIPQGYAFYRSIGITSMDIVSKEVSFLDDLHTMVKIHWKSAFTRKDNTQDAIEFDVIYFLQHLENRAEIFAYIVGDEQKALKEKGLI